MAGEQNRMTAVGGGQLCIAIDQDPVQVTTDPFFGPFAPVVPIWPLMAIVPPPAPRTTRVTRALPPVAEERVETVNTETPLAPPLPQNEPLPAVPILE